MIQIDLILKKEPFDQIFKGEKKEDYRHPSIFNNRLLGVKAADGLYDPRTDIERVRFFNGYNKDRKYMILECKKIRVDKKKEGEKTLVRLAIELGALLEHNV